MIAQSNFSEVNVSSRRGRMKKEHETVIASIRPRLTGQTEHILDRFLREMVPVVEEAIIARTTPVAAKRTQEAPVQQKKSEPTRRASTKLYQAEKLLEKLLPGEVVPIKSLKKDLRKEIELYRMSAYLWDLKQIGADVVRHKKGRKIVALELKNPKDMEGYLQKRRSEIAA